MFPGAGTGADQPGLVAIEEALAPLPVERRDFAYRAAGRKAPPRAPTLVAEVLAAAGEMAARLGCGPGELVLGGRSMGGRMCSMAVADGLPAAGLILVAYPLHPPGKPDKSRTEHLPRVQVPCLFVSGTKDPFGSPDELEAATAAIAGDVTHEWLDGKGHDLKGADARVADAVDLWTRAVGMATVASTEPGRDR